MMNLALAAAALFAALGVTLALNARAYVRRVERLWPAFGEFIPFEEARIHVAARGPEGGAPVLLIHGASANLRELWSAFETRLAPGARVIAFDRPGYGYSTRPRAAHRLKMQADIAARVLETYAQGPALVIAHSLGAGVALRLAAERPDLVRGLVLLAPASHPWPSGNAWWAEAAANPIYGPLFAGLIAPWIGPARMKSAVANTFAPAPAPLAYADEAGVPLTLRPRAFRASARDVVSASAEFAAQTPLYGDILAPTVILTADKDRVVSPKIHARALAVEMAAAELVIAPGAGHMPHRVRPDLAMAAIARVEAMASAAPAD